MTRWEDLQEDAEILAAMRRDLEQPPKINAGGQDGIVKEWTDHYGDGTSCDYVERERDGKWVLSYRNYADPPESNASPLDSASSLDTSICK
jgi:hypothetical protein